MVTMGSPSMVGAVTVTSFSVPLPKAARKQSRTALSSARQLARDGLVGAARGHPPPALGRIRQAAAVAAPAPAAAGGDQQGQGAWRCAVAGFTSTKGTLPAWIAVDGERYLLPAEPVDVGRRVAGARRGQGPRRRPQAGRRVHHRRDQPVGAAGTGRRRVSHRAQVGRHPQPGRHPPLRGVQRGRGRAGHVQGPGHPAGQPVPGGRGHRHRRPHRRRPRGLHRDQGQVHRRDRTPHPGGRGDAGGGAGGRHRHHHRGGARGVPLRRGEGHARGHRGPAADAPDPSALRARPVRHRPPDGLGGGHARARPSRRPPVEPHPGQQRGDAGQRPPHPGPGGGVVPHHGHRRLARPPRDDGGGRRRPSRRGRGRPGHAPVGGDRHGGRRAAGPGAGRSRPCSRGWPTR